MTAEVASLGAEERATLAAVADQLIPAADGMPSAAEVLSDERLRFVLKARPDLRRAAAARRFGPTLAATSRPASTRSGATSRRTSVRSSW